MRLDKPIGIYLTLLPALWAIAFAADNIFQLIWLFIVFCLGAIVIRGAGCILNDIADKELDKKVERTKTRPLASEELTVSEAYKFLFLLLGVGFLLLLTLPTPVIFIGLFSIFPIAAYPYFKRFTYYPQVALGFVFNLGVFMGWYSADPRVSVVPFVLYLASLLWTVGYDTIYGLQDKKDDSNAGIKSMSLLFGEATPKLVWRLYLAALLLIAITGLNAHMNLLFYVFLLAGGYQLYWQTETLKVNSPNDCLNKFKSNAQFGLILLIGILVGRI
jgi:4-hydroxybenzoate polyprenyl transferase